MFINRFGSAPVNTSNILFYSVSQFYKNFSSGLKDVVWNTDSAAEEQKQ